MTRGSGFNLSIVVFVWRATKSLQTK